MRSIVLGLALVAPLAASAAPASPGNEQVVEQELRRVQEQNQHLEAQLRAMHARLEEVERRSAQPGPGDLIASGRVVVGPGVRASEAVSLRDDVIVDGHVTGDAVSVMGDVVVTSTGRVDGDAVSIGGEVVLADGAVVGGDRVALGLTRAPTLLEVPTPEATSHHAAGALALASQASETLSALYRRLVLLLAVAGAGVMTVGLFPGRVARVAADLEERPLRSAIVGSFGVTFLTLFAALFALLTLGIGSPVSLAVLLGVGAAWLLGFVGFCQAIGDRLPFAYKPHGRWLAFLVGAVFLAFATSLPWMGWLVLLGVSVVGVGSALSTRLGAH